MISKKILRVPKQHNMLRQQITTQTVYDNYDCYSLTSVGLSMCFHAQVSSVLPLVCVCLEKYLLLSRNVQQNCQGPISIPNVLFYQAIRKSVFPCVIFFSKFNTKILSNAKLPYVLIVLVVAIQLSSQCLKLQPYMLRRSQNSRPVDRNYEK